MTQLKEIVQYLDQTIDSKGFDDNSLNGLQIESGQNEILRVAYAVDAGLSVLDEAISRKCQLLIVHHGIFWGSCQKIEGILGKKIRTLIEGGCSLYVSHLPLDWHPELGNNACIIKKLDAQIEKGFCYSGSKPIGYIANLKSALDIQEFELKLKAFTEKERFLSLKFGSNKVSKLAVISGGGSFAIEEAHALGADCFITGEPKHSNFHLVKELGINAFFAGHYATETFGVEAVANELKKKFGLEIEFIDQPSLI